MKKIIALTAVVLTIVGCSEDPIPAEKGNSFGKLIMSGTPLVGENLTASVSDGNGVVDSAISYTWYADDVMINNSSTNTLILTESEVGSAVYVTVSYTDNDNYTETIKSSTTSPVLGLSNPATFSGNLAAAILNTTTEVITGQIIVIDPDEGENIVVEQQGTITNYGVFSITPEGNWSYQLDTANALIGALVNENDILIDSITVYSADGESTTLELSISGQSTASSTTKAAKITDNMTDDAGELRYKLDSSINSGKLTVSFLKEDNATTSDGIAKDAYIGLYGESTSTSNALLDLRIQADKFVIRDQDIDVEIPFIPGKWNDVEMTWDATLASGSIPPLVTIAINGTSVTTEAFSSASSSLSDVMTGVRYAIFKLGDNSSTIPNAAYYIDNIKLYSDQAGSSVAFEDDFETYNLGDSLDDDNVSSPYNSSTASAVVEEVTTGSSTPEVENQIAQITDNMTDDAGELRYKLDTAITAGKLTVSLLKQDNATSADGTPKDAYIGLYGESTSTSNAIVDLRIQADKFVVRDQDFEVTAPFTPGQWTEVEMTWDATAASASSPPLVTISINGTNVTTEAFSSASSSLSDVMTGVRYAIFKIGDNSSTIPNAAYFVDDIRLYSDLTGATIAFADDFESYNEGDSLDTDNPASPYNSSTAEAVVVKQ